MHLAVTSLGLATNWATALQFTLVHRLVKQLLALPEELEVFDLMAGGHAAVRPCKKLMRDKKKMVHHGSIGNIFRLYFFISVMMILTSSSPMFCISWAWAFL
jgi:hypothetical protein